MGALEEADCDIVAQWAEDGGKGDKGWPVKCCCKISGLFPSNAFLEVAANVGARPNNEGLREEAHKLVATGSRRLRPIDPEMKTRLLS